MPSRAGKRSVGWAISKRLRVLVAIDDTRAARAAIATVVRFPWSDATPVRGVVALRAGYFGLRSKALDDALEASLQDAAASARTALSARCGDAEVACIRKAPLDAILAALVVLSMIEAMLLFRMKAPKPH